jgi:hypothetical protein
MKGAGWGAAFGGTWAPPGVAGRAHPAHLTILRAPWNLMCSMAKALLFRSSRQRFNILSRTALNSLPAFHSGNVAAIATR